mmetsp:Transcript_73904/g.204778  ORF Transcript_73904/g.204778 Transcript_73904/m.204778 type:complete len:271 (-) Transcript_73904:277-1089(-)
MCPAGALFIQCPCMEGRLYMCRSASLPASMRVRCFGFGQRVSPCLERQEGTRRSQRDAALRLAQAMGRCRAVRVDEPLASRRVPDHNPLPRPIPPAGGGPASRHDEPVRRYRDALDLGNALAAACERTQVSAGRYVEDHGLHVEEHDQAPATLDERDGENAVVRVYRPREFPGGAAEHHGAAAETANGHLASALRDGDARDPIHAPGQLGVQGARRRIPDISAAGTSGDDLGTTQGELEVADAVSRLRQQVQRPAGVGVPYDGRLVPEPR